MANFIKSKMRSSDAVYRFGGDEFVILMPGANSEEAQMRAEMLRGETEEHDLNITNDQGEAVVLNKTLSIGVVGTNQLENWNKANEYFSGEDFLKELMRAADVAVYKSKEKGRNSVTVYSESLMEEMKNNKEKNLVDFTMKKLIKKEESD